MPLIARTIEEALAPIADGCVLLIPRESSGVAMEATRALIRRGVRRLHLVACPTSTLQADLLIGAGCVETLETSAVSLGEFGPAPRFTAAVTSGAIRLKDATCPALHAALQAAEKGVPFMPLRGLIGSDVLAHRPDWRVDRQSVRQRRSDRAASRRSRRDVALFHAPMADRDGNVWIGTNRDLVTMAHAAREDDRHRRDAARRQPARRSACSRPARSPGFYVEAVAVAPRGAWPLRLAEHYPADAAHLAEYARLAATRGGLRPLPGAPRP